MVFERKIENYSGKLQVVVEVSHGHEESPGTARAHLLCLIMRFNKIYIYMYVQLGKFGIFSLCVLNMNRK